MVSFDGSIQSTLLGKLLFTLITLMRFIHLMYVLHSHAISHYLTFRLNDFLHWLHSQGQKFLCGTWNYCHLWKLLRYGMQSADLFWRLKPFDHYIWIEKSSLLIKAPIWNHKIKLLERTCEVLIGSTSHYLYQCRSC